MLSMVKDQVRLLRKEGSQSHSNVIYQLESIIWRRDSEKASQGVLYDGKADLPDGDSIVTVKTVLRVLKYPVPSLRKVSHSPTMAASGQDPRAYPLAARGSRLLHHH